MKRLLLLLGGVSLWATTIYPIPIYIEKPMKVQRLSIKDDRSRYQVFVEGEKDILVYPKIFRAPKTLKIIYKGKRPTTEKSYRIVLQELLLDENKERGVMRIVKRFSLPLFVLPQNPQPRLTYECKEGGIILKNEGNVHFLISFSNGKKVHWYLYPNQSKEVRDVRSVELRTDKGAFKFNCKEAK